MCASLSAFIHDDFIAIERAGFSSSNPAVSLNTALGQGAQGHTRNVTWQCPFCRVLGWTTTDIGVLMGRFARMTYLTMLILTAVTAGVGPASPQLPHTHGRVHVAHSNSQEHVPPRPSMSFVLHLFLPPSLPFSLNASCPLSLSPSLDLSISLSLPASFSTSISLHPSLHLSLFPTSHIRLAGVPQHSTPGAQRPRHHRGEFKLPSRRHEHELHGSSIRDADDICP